MEEKTQKKMKILASSSYHKHGRNCESLWMHHSERKYDKSIWSIFALSDDGGLGSTNIKHSIQILKSMFHQVEPEKAWQMHLQVP